MCGCFLTCFCHQYDQTRACYSYLLSSMQPHWDKQVIKREPITHEYKSFMDFRECPHSINMKTDSVFGITEDYSVLVGSIKQLPWDSFF